MLFQDIRYAIRQLRKSPAFTLTVIGTLCVGIGLNAAIFTVVDCVLLRPLGYRDADRIVALQTRFTNQNRSIPRLGGDDYNDLVRQVKGLEATAYYQSGSDGIVLNGAAIYLPVAFVSPGFTQVMGVEAIAGRAFQANDPDVGNALVSAEFARDHFGSAQAALGQTIQYDGRSRSILGVLPASFAFPGSAAVWLEQKSAPETANRTAYNQRVLGKRRIGVSPGRLSAELAAFSSQLQQAYPEDRLKSIEAIPLQEQLTGKIRPMLNLLMGSVAVILLIVCANITHLQLVRATRQLRAVSIRTALGATRGALVSTAIVEALLLACGGFLAALAVAFPALRLLLLIAPADIPRLSEVHLNGTVLAFSFALSVLLVCVTSALPVWGLWRANPAAALRQDTSRGTEGRAGAGLRNSFLIAEVALTFTLTVAAVTLSRQLIEQSRRDLGFSPDSLVTLDVHAVDTNPQPTPQQVEDATPAQIEAWEAQEKQRDLSRLDSALDSLRAVPGVDSVAAIGGAPMGFGGSDVGYAVKGRQVFGAPGMDLPNAEVRPVTPDLFGTMQIPLVRGRALTVDDRMGAPMVLLINAELARQVFPGQDPVGQQIMCGFDEHTAWWTIVGVVGNIRDGSPADAPTPTFYIPVAQHPYRATEMQLVVRTHLDPATLLDTLTGTLRKAHPEIAIKATTMRQNIGETQRVDDFRALLFGSFAAVSILLAAVGMWGVTAYTVAQRRFEFGLRIALGANRVQVLGMVLRKALVLAAVGIGMGLALALGLTRALAGVIGKLPEFEAASYLVAGLAVLGIALLATLAPARAAANSDPMTVLRSE